jgi:hypothetical protein
MSRYGTGAQTRVVVNTDQTRAAERLRNGGSAGATAGPRPLGRLRVLQRSWNALSRSLRLGVGGAALAFVGLVGLQILAVPAFIPADESANVDYAYHVAHGHIPLVGSWVQPVFPHQRHVPNTTSNHPPAYHLLAGLVLRAGLALHSPVKAVFAARVLTALIGLAAVVLAAVLVLAWRGRGYVKAAVGAAGLTAVLTQLIQVAGVVENDAMSMALSFGALAALLWIIRAGPSPGRLALVAGCTALALLTRAQAVALVAIVAAALVVAALIRTDDGRLPRHRLRTGAAHAGLVLVVCAATSGWFYLLNAHRYGDPLGGSVVYQLQRLTKQHDGMPFEPTATSLAAFLTNPRSWARLFAQFYGGARLEITPQPGWVVAVSVGCAAILGVAVLVHLGRALRAGARPTPAGVLCTLVVIAMFVATVAETGQNAVDGAGANGRYLLLGVGLYVAGTVIVLQTLPPLLAVPGQLTLLGAELVGTFAVMLSIIRRQPRLAGANWFSTFHRSMVGNGVPAAGAVLVALLVLTAIGIGLLTAVLLRNIPTAVDPPAGAD